MKPSSCLAMTDDGTALCREQGGRDLETPIQVYPPVFSLQQPFLMGWKIKTLQKKTGRPSKPILTAWWVLRGSFAAWL